jgi:hypothetical protein
MRYDIYDMIYLLAAIGLPTAGSTHLHTSSKQNNTVNLGSVRAVPCLCEFYPGICLPTEEKAWKTLSQGSRKVPVSTTKIEHTEKNIHFTLRLGNFDTGLRVKERSKQSGTEIDF